MVVSHQVVQCAMAKSSMRAAFQCMSTHYSPTHTDVRFLYSGDPTQVAASSLADTAEAVVDADAGHTVESSTRQLPVLPSLEDISFRTAKGPQFEEAPLTSQHVASSLSWELTDSHPLMTSNSVPSPLADLILLPFDALEPAHASLQGMSRGTCSLHSLASSHLLCHIFCCHTMLVVHVMLPLDVGMTSLLSCC